ncbi:MAG: aminodeoxychorismate synthase component I [Bacteroidetes bacterium]|nr:aminodeoxychorismate synthase component I [Bacteroidota bacterium]
MTLSEFESTLNHWGQEQVPFLFLVDFERERPLAWKINDVPSEILYSVRGFSNRSAAVQKNKTVKLRQHPISLSTYKTKFDYVKKKITLGDSYLTNLTVKTKIEIDASLEELFLASHADYKLCWKNKFLVFSPETFVQIRDGKIFSFPMKGTIDASIPAASKIILENPKELSEHVTIVDLIRNDLSAVAADVRVSRFRFISEIKNPQKNLLQVSSEIVGSLAHDYKSRLGTILTTLLPAGSISGAPKKKTAEIIAEAEGEKRNYYTGVFGYFDGTNLDSAVMIRFIEQEMNQFYYRSGGGITAQSEVEKEYHEVLDKIYVPVY